MPNRRHAVILAGMFKEFREFAVKGNMIDLAVAVIIGGAFAKIIDSLVKDVIMPPIGLALGGVDFANMFKVLKEGVPPGPYATPADALKAGAVTWNYGLFVNTVINFLIVAFCIFMVVKAINRMKRAQAAAPAPPAGPTKDQELLTEIRDLLKKA